MYIVGYFNRNYWNLSSNDKPMELTWIKETITKDDLVKTQKEDEYQVIDLDRLMYYDPKQNKWLELEKI